MRLYIVRHGIAVPHGVPGVAENDRPLTDKGIEKMKEGAAGLRKLGFIPEVILSSPLPRARQTAEILRRAYGKRSRLKLLPALAPGGKRPEVYREIRVNQECKSLMLVGHQPSLGEIAAEIVWGSSGQGLELKKGGACALKIEELDEVPRGKLLWLLTPSILSSV